MRRLRPSPAMIVAFIALFIAIGGSSYAVTRLPAKSVGSKQIRKGAVRTTHLAKGAVTGAKVKDGSLSGGGHQPRLAERRHAGATPPTPVPRAGWTG